MDIAAYHKRIRQLLADGDHEQQELARYIQVTDSYLSQAFKRKSGLTKPKTLALIASFFKVSEEYLLLGKKTKGQTQQLTSHQHLDHVRKLPLSDGTEALGDDPVSIHEIDSNTVYVIEVKPERGSSKDPGGTYVGQIMVAGDDIVIACTDGSVERYPKKRTGTILPYLGSFQAHKQYQ